MQLIRISGDTEPMRRLGEIEGLQFERTSATRLDGERWQVSGYASDDALAQIEARGLSVESVVEPEQLAAQHDVLFTKLAADTAALAANEGAAGGTDEGADPGDGTDEDAGPVDGTDASPVDGTDEDADPGDGTDEDAGPVDGTDEDAR